MINFCVDSHARSCGPISLAIAKVNVLRALGLLSVMIPVLFTDSNSTSPVSADIGHGPSSDEDVNEFVWSKPDFHNRVPGVCPRRSFRIKLTVADIPLSRNLILFKIISSNRFEKLSL